MNNSLHNITVSLSEIVIEYLFTKLNFKVRISKFRVTSRESYRQAGCAAARPARKHHHRNLLITSQTTS